MQLQDAMPPFSEDTHPPVPSSSRAPDKHLSFFQTTRRLNFLSLVRLAAKLLS